MLGGLVFVCSLGDSEQPESKSIVIAVREANVFAEEGFMKGGSLVSLQF